MPNKFVDKEQFFLLIEAGFIAVNQADEDSALKIFKACELLNPSNTLSQIGMGYLHFHKLELKQAIDIFKRVLEREPQNDMAKALLGMSLSLSPTQGAEGEKLLTEIAKDSHDPQIRTVANTSIDFVDRFVKKEKGPLHPGMNKPKHK